MLGRGEVPAPPSGNQRRRDPEGPFSRDMQRIRRKILDQPCKPQAGQQREAGLRIGWAGQGAKLFPADHRHPIAHRRKLISRPS